MYAKIITAHSVSDALAQGLKTLTSLDNVLEEESRNGKVFVHDGPVITHSQYPARRVLFSPKRDANPFFHLFESLWMLGGRNDLPWLAQFNRQMKAYSDDGGLTQPAAYGYRWRRHFGHDQLDELALMLRHDGGTRRAVLTMWDGGRVENEYFISSDLLSALSGSSDVPCNTQCYFTVRDAKLHMTVTCRSNDILWGAHGANAVHFSILLEYMAAKCGLVVGEMFQYSWNYHLYDGILKHKPWEVEEDLYDTDRYVGNPNALMPTVIVTHEDVEAFDTELPHFLDWAAPEPQCGAPIDHPFLKGTALPMLEAWRAAKEADWPKASNACMQIKGADWMVACTEWIQRRIK